MTIFCHAESIIDTIPFFSSDKLTVRLVFRQMSVDHRVLVGEYLSQPFPK